MFRTSNPALSDKALRAPSSAASSEPMTIEGAVNRSAISILITMATAYWAYTNPSLSSMYWICFGIGIVCWLAIMFKQSLAPLLTPVYAAAEGVILGLLSIYADMQFPGIAFQAVSLTFGTLFCLLIAYRSGYIKVTEKFRTGLIAATGAIFLMYLVSFIASFFGANFSFIHSSSPLSIGISVVVVIVAALNLTLDFDLIERLAADGRQPKYMEWYAAFALLVTLVWLYIEMLRLLMKLQSRD